MNNKKIVLISPHKNKVVLDLTEIKKHGFDEVREFYFGAVCLDLAWEYINHNDKKAYEKLLNLLKKEQQRKFVKEYKIRVKGPGYGVSIKYYSGRKGGGTLLPPLTKKEKKRREKLLKEAMKNSKTPEEELRESYIGLCKTLENGDYIFKCDGGGEIGNSGKFFVEKIKKILEDDSLTREEKIKKIRKYYSGYGDCMDTLLDTYKRKKR
ncbi:glycoside hydrolase family 18 protein [bacterium]|nr:glycoside hydrolase family 18 protein [bacterium]